MEGFSLIRVDVRSLGPASGALTDRSIATVPSIESKKDWRAGCRSEAPTEITYTTARTTRKLVEDLGETCRQANRVSDVMFLAS